MPSVSTILGVDVGNSFIKTGVFQAEDVSPQPLQVLRAKADEAPQAIDLYLQGAKIHSEHCLWAVATVHRAAEKQFRAWAEKLGGRYHRLTWSDFGIPVDVRHPEKVGVDRLAAATAADNLRAAQSPAIVVDAGSAVTVDWLSTDGVYHGGAILPGLRTQMASLVKATDQLPVVAAPLEPPLALGKDTESAIRSGVYWGVVGAVRELIARLEEQFGEQAQVFFTGGDSEGLASHWENAVNQPHLVLQGAALAGKRLLQGDAP